MDYLLGYLLPGFIILVWNLGLTLFIKAAAGSGTQLEVRFEYKKQQEKRRLERNK